MTAYYASEGRRGDQFIVPETLVREIKQNYDAVCFTPGYKENS
jgi:hypothetical protein